MCICTHNSDRRGSCLLCSMSGSPAPGAQAVSTAPPPTLTVGLSLLTAGCMLLCKLAQVMWVPCARLMGVGPVAEMRLPSCLFCGATPHICSSSVPACPARLPASLRWHSLSAAPGGPAGRCLLCTEALLGGFQTTSLPRGQSAGPSQAACRPSAWPELLVDHLWPAVTTSHAAVR